MIVVYRVKFTQVIAARLPLGYHSATTEMMPLRDQPTMEREHCACYFFTVEWAATIEVKVLFLVPLSFLLK